MATIGRKGKSTPCSVPNKLHSHVGKRGWKAIPWKKTKTALEDGLPSQKPLVCEDILIILGLMAREVHHFR